MADCASGRGQESLGKPPISPKMTPEQMHGIADLLRSLPFWPIVVVLLAWMFRSPLGKLIANVAKLRGPGGWEVEINQEAIAQAKKVLTTPPPADADPQIEAAKSDPEMAKLLVSVAGKWVPIEEFLGRVADAYRLPRTPTTWLVAASGLLTAHSTTVTTTGSVNLQGDQVMYTPKPEVRPALEEKAKEDR